MKLDDLLPSDLAAKVRQWEATHPEPQVHAGTITAVEFGRTTVEDEYDDGTVTLEHHDEPGTYTLTVTGLPETMAWSAGMTVTIHQAEETQ